VNIITTVPNVKYKVVLKGGEELDIESPAKMPPAQDLESISEPIAKMQIISPTEFVGAIMKLCEDKRGKMTTMEYLEPTRVCLHYRIPLSEMILTSLTNLKAAHAAMPRWITSLTDTRKTPGQTRYSHQRSLLTLSHHSLPGQRLSFAAGNNIKAQRTHPQTAVRSGNSAAIGSKVIARNNCQTLPQRCHLKVLRWRYHTEKKTAGKAERG
jgi:GTP-binding protein LepA